MSKSHVVQAKLDMFGGQRKLRIAIREGSTLKNVFLPVPQQQTAEEFAEACRAFAQTIAPKKAQPAKRKAAKKSTEGGEK